MDQQLASLLLNFWRAGTLDSAKVLADRLQELPAEDVAQALVEFHQLVKVTPALAQVSRSALEGVRAALRPFAEFVGRLRPEQENLPP